METFKKGEPTDGNVFMRFLEIFVSRIHSVRN